MSTGTIKELIENVERVIYSPASIQRAVYTHLEEISEGEATIVDVSNPFVALIGSCAAMTTAAVNKMSAEHRRQYEKASTTMADLYDHISDKDISEIYARPSQITIELSFAFAELESKLVYDATLGIRKLTIPRNTTFKVASIPFSLQYPVEIRKMEHGGLTIVHDTEIESPLKKLTSNVIPWGKFEYNNASGEWLTMKLEVDQFDIVSKTGSIVQSQLFAADVAISDQFYTARVFVNSGNGFKEIPVVLSARVVDLAEPCAVATVYENLIRFSIPQIFTHNGQLSGNVRIDVYQTKGDIDIDLSTYPVSEFQANWLALDPAERTVYTAPFSTMESVAIASSSRTRNGRVALPVDDVRKRIFANSIGTRNIPITPSQIGVALEDRGYSIIRNIDVVTDRIFLATRELEAPKASDYSTLLELTINPRASSGIAANIGTLITKLSTIVDKSGVINNGDRVTITPDALFVVDGDQIEHLTQAEVTQLKALSTDLMALELNNRSYRYTPFYYTLDCSTSDFDLRAYYMSEPKITEKVFINENASTLLQVGIDIVDLQKTETGYSLLLRTVSSDAVKQLLDNELICQLATTPAKERDRAYINGALFRVEDDGERVYEFNLTTQYDFDRDGNLIFDGFYMYEEQPVKIGVPLDATFDVFFITTSDVGEQFRYSGIDSAIGSVILPPVKYGVNHEQLLFNFGMSMDALWKRARSYVDESMYQRYTEDIPARYEEAVYDRDPVSGLTFNIVNGAVVYRDLLHEVNDIMEDELGNTIYLHRAGDIVLVNGEPVLVSERVVSRYLDLLLLDGLYYFVTDNSILNYRNNAHRSLATWIDNDLEELTKQALDKTNIFYYPKAMIGTIEAIVNDNRRVNIQAEQSLILDLHVSESVNRNDALKNSLVSKSTSVLKTALKKTQIAISDIVAELKAIYGNDVIDVRISGLGGSSDFSAVTIVNDETRLSLKKKIVILADGSTTVVDDVTFNWIRHTK